MERRRDVRECQGPFGGVSACVKDTHVGDVCVGGEGCAGGGGGLKDDYEGRRGGEEVLERVGSGKTRVIMYGMMGCKQAKCEFRLESPMRMDAMVVSGRGRAVPVSTQQGGMVCGMRDEHANRRYEDNSRWYDMIHITETTVRGARLSNERGSASGLQCASRCEGVCLDEVGTRRRTTTGKLCWLRSRLELEVSQSSSTEKEAANPEHRDAQAAAAASGLAEPPGRKYRAQCKRRESVCSLHLR